MRLVCPKCEAKYEVPDDAIPDTGRDVQCANCSHAWFQVRTRTMPVAPPAPVAPAATEKPAAKVSASVPTPPAAMPVASDKQFDAWPEANAAGTDDGEAAGVAVPVHDEKVLTILREEAAREAKARREKTRPLGYQSDLGVEQAAEPRTKAAAKVKEPEPAPPRAAEPVRAPEPARPPEPERLPEPEPEIELKVAARRDLLPDVEEIKSTLQPSETPEPEFAAGAYADSDGHEERGAFRSGFLLVITVAILGASVYSTAPWLAAKVPALSGPLSVYVAGVDTVRLKLDELMRSATLLIAGDKG